MQRAWLVVAALVATAACGGDTTGGEATRVAQLGGGTWVLTTGTVDGVPIEVAAQHRVSLTVDGGRVGGTAACNQYGGRLRLSEGRVRIDELAQTEMACEPASLMEAERLYLTGLGRVEAATRAGDSLTMSGPAVELTFALEPPVPAEDLVGSVWELDTLVRDGAASSARGAPATLELGDDGTLAGGTGCRRLTGRYVLHGDEVRVTQLSADGECSGDLRDQDALVVEVLGDGFRASVDGRRLTLTSDGGAGLGYRAR